MSQITKDGVTYNTPDCMPGDIALLIADTGSMNIAEKKYWFDVYPSMTKEQRERLHDILETEKRKLDELEKKYQKEVERLKKVSIQ